MSLQMLNDNSNDYVLQTASGRSTGDFGNAEDFRNTKGMNSLYSTNARGMSGIEIPQTTNILANIGVKAQKATALYLRLSSDDGNIGDSDSIVNQRAMVTKYAKDNDFANIIEFVDDGWSGIDFQNRPQFQEMLSLVESGQIGTIIVKDLSRLGREYIQMGFYTEIIFPKYNVRFIAINDSVDSNKGADDFSALRNLFNEWFIRDTSRKIRAVKDMKAKQGKRSGGFAPYGYIFDKEQDKLIIEEATAPTIRRIYDLYISGLGYKRIANMLTSEGIPTPTVYKGHKLIYLDTIPEEWSDATISDILRNRVYIGHTVSKQTTTLSYKHKQIIYNKEEDMIVVENTHDAIIDNETFDIAKNLRLGKRRPTKNGENVMFSGLVYCPDCGKRHYLAKGGKDNRFDWLYNCGNYRQGGKDHRKGKNCTSHSIRLGVLEKIVTEHLRMVTAYVKDNEKEFAQMLMEKSTSSQKSDIAKKKRELDKAKRRTSELDKLFNKIYEDRTLGKLSEERYERMTADFDHEQQELSASIKIWEQEIAQTTDAISGIDRFIKIVKKHIDLEELNATILRELVEKIVVHEKVRTVGYDSRGRQRKPIHQQVDIYYNFVGVIQ